LAEEARSAGRSHLASLVAAAGAVEAEDLGAELRWVETSLDEARRDRLATEVGAAATAGRRHLTGLAGEDAAGEAARQAAELDRASAAIAAGRHAVQEQEAAVAGHHIEIDLTISESAGEATGLTSELARAGAAIGAARTRQAVDDAARSAAGMRPLEAAWADLDQAADRAALQAELAHLDAARVRARDALAVEEAARRGAATERRLLTEAAVEASTALSGELARIAAAAAQITPTVPSAGAPVAPVVAGTGASVAESPVRGWRRLWRRRAPAPAHDGPGDQVSSGAPAAAGDGRVRSEVTEASETAFPDVENTQEDAGVEPAESTLQRPPPVAPAAPRPPDPPPDLDPGWRIEDFDVPEWSDRDTMSDRSDQKPEPELDFGTDDDPETPAPPPTGEDPWALADLDKADAAEELAGDELPDEETPDEERGWMPDDLELPDEAFEPFVEPVVETTPDMPATHRGVPAPVVPPSAGPTDQVADEDEDDDDIPDFARFTSEEYVQASTREYAGLAEAVARAAEEEHQPMAISAGMPGLDTGVVGLDDVMDVADGVEDDGGSTRISDLPIRIVTGLLLGGLFLASLLRSWAIGVLVLIVLGLAVGELFTVLIRNGRHPLALFGFLGVAGAFLGTWFGNLVAVPVALLVTIIAVLFFYAVVPGRTRPLENASLTTVGVAWIGGFGAFAFDILDSPHYRWLFGALVVTVALMDSAQYFVGRHLGRHALAPVVSPKKTVEGLIGGILVALATGAAFGMFEPFDLVNGLVLGAVVAVVAPFGDLAVSVIKRSIGVKDMGTILPGHGGVLDRIDAVLFVIPAAWMAYSWMGLLA
jgi:CDP-diglyceride synthetase